MFEKAKNWCKTNKEIVVNAAALTGIAGFIGLLQLQETQKANRRAQSAREDMIDTLDAHLDSRES